MIVVDFIDTPAERLPAQEDEDGLEREDNLQGRFSSRPHLSKKLRPRSPSGGNASRDRPQAS